ncbi:MAG: hypothetical protein EBY17_19900 [Acidobacteriia bacterium]|nr:hypothetical protein [Terriglobia bacterium]
MKLFLSLCLAATAIAAPPSLTEIAPRGAQQGKTLTVTLSGRDLAEGSKILSTLPAIFTPLTPTMKGLTYLLELKADAPPGVYPIRVQNPNGLSNILFFTVGTFPEISESETPNNSLATAEFIKATPVTLNGTLKGPDRDYYRIAGKLNQRLVFEVEARRSGSAIDSVLELHDEKGTLLARNENAPGLGTDSRIDYTFPRDGNFYLSLHDVRFSKQDQNFYRLKIGTFAYPEAIFPLGGRHGETVEFEFSSRKSGITKTTVKLPETGAFTTLAMPGSPTLPFPIALTDAADIINGRIAKPGQIDRYPIKVTPGEVLLIELLCREIGTSRLDALVTLYDAKTQKKLTAVGDQPPVIDLFNPSLIGRIQGDPVINFTVPADTAEITLAVEDLARRGGPEFGYRLSIRKQATEFLVSASPAYLNVPRGGTVQVAVNLDRRGYDGEVHATIPNLPKGWHAAGGFIAPEILDSTGARSGSRSGVITVTADPDAELPTTDFKVVAEGGGLKRTAAGSGAVIDVAAGTGLPDASSTDRQKAFTAPWLNIAMPAALTNPPAAALSVKQIKRTEMAEGDAFDFEWTITTKNPGLAMPTNIAVNAPGAKDLRTIDMKPTAKGAPTGTFRVTTTKSTAAATYDFIVSANLTVDGNRETIFSQAIPWAVSNKEVSSK